MQLASSLKFGVPSTLNWHYDEWFAPVAGDVSHPAIIESITYVDESRIQDHPFFAAAGVSRDILRLWVSQELIVTNPFAQLLMNLAASLGHVHIRSMIMQIARGEHGPLRDRVAPLAHPWLLHQLGGSVGLTPGDVTPFAETVEFLREIESACATSPLTAVGVLGMGSERLLIPEYTAIKGAFETGWPDCDFRRFLDANITEDEQHASLMEVVAASMIELGADPSDFVKGTQIGVDSRITYYTRLHQRVAGLG
ncbi:iron-containing redox enzyme family protein [Catellatospora sp. KI3]|uniref:iron-containing redox enzyme family protein n=1 Tax=Catellatospora sp. KI3 TaxID=3041620 RepID=UPI002482BA90|nr:iron-containing redox enzyme family protein [Catellatospora sp. KI3]MDI1463223.1 iron-containing redox enzyme family protein [Catellatospora sp. KI3]